MTNSLTEAAGALVQRLKEMPAFGLVAKLVRFGVPAGVLAFMGYRLSDIGWDTVMGTLPIEPLFYIFFAVMFLAYPIAEKRVYGLIWNEREKARLDVFLKMRAYNFAVASYSGEAFLALWARKTLNMPKRQIFSTIKDSNILSALASNSFTILLLMALVFSDQLHVITDENADFEYYLALAFLVGVVLVPIVILFRRHLISIEPALGHTVFLTHLCRQIIVLAAQVAMWAVAVPEAPFSAWLLLLTAQMVLTRIPFLPNTDLLLAGLGITLMGQLGAPEGKLAGMFFATGVLGQVCNLAAFVISSVREPLRARQSSPENA